MKKFVNDPQQFVPEMLKGIELANPGKLKFATSGVASAPHLAGAVLFDSAAVQVTDVPYRGETAYLTHLLAGEVDMGAVSANLVTSQKGLKPLAVFATPEVAVGAHRSWVRG